MPQLDVVIRDRRRVLAREARVTVLVSRTSSTKHALQASALGRMAVYDGSQASLAVPELTKRLHPNFPRQTRTLAAIALGSYGVSASNATPRLLIAIEDADPQVRVEATNALRKITPSELTKFPLAGYGVAASNAIPSLLAAMEDPNPLIRQQATDALLQIAPWEVTNFPTLVPINSYFPGSTRPHQRGERP